MRDLLTALGDWRGFNALVVGDFMLDELVFGDAERLSPDAPVPVLRHRRTEHQPGGAANVCRDLAAMRASVRAVGLVGEDDSGRHLRDALELAGVDASGLVVDADRPTTVKRSLIGLAQHRHPQKMFRVDYETKDPPSPEALDRLLAAFDAALADSDIVCLEDYDKGVLTPTVSRELIRRARRAGKEVLVDPAATDDFADRYIGATGVTPNRSEAEGALRAFAASPPAPPELARRLLEACELEVVVMTLDKDGALLLERDGSPVSVPTVARQVYDVTGAGDMVLAGLAAARANGVSWAESVELANAAAGLEVEVFGVQPIPIERVHHAVLTLRGGLRGKVRALDELVIEVRSRKNAGQNIVFTNGCFDILHTGHIRLLEEARKQGDMLIVGLNDDDSIRRLKGEDRPVNTTQERGKVLSALESVDAISVFTDDTPVELIRAIVPDVLVKGSDYTVDTVVGADIVLNAGGRVHLVDLLEGKSTTGTIARMRAP